MNILFKNARIISDTEDEKLYFVAVTEKKISYIGVDEPNETYDKVIDCNENLLTPAFYNAHCHSAMTLLRGIGEDLPLQSWLDDAILPAEEHLNFRRTYYGSRLAIAEMIRNGIVSFSDMYMFEDATAEAVLESGIKANLSRSIVSFESIAKNEDKRLSEALSLYDKYNGAGDGRLKIDFSLHAEYSNQEATCRYVAETAAERGARLQLHLSETKKEHEECMERHNGLTPAAYFASIGVFDVPTVAAHCVYCTDEDIAILKEKGVFPVHNPVSNLKLGSGVMPLRKMLDAGIPVALGTDGAASNNSLDILRELQFASILHKGVNCKPDITHASEMISLATRNGALSQGREDCGALQVGAAADLILIDLNAINNIPCRNPAATLCYSANVSNVLLTMADGRILYQDGEYTSIDIECLRFEARQVIRHYFE